MHIFSVRTLTQAIKEALEGEFPFVCVRGRVVNISNPTSGYLSFSSDNEETG
jgi:exodeoxyribonuclease VII large subunit